MIEYIRGNIDELTPTEAVIEAHGVGYLLNISLNTYSALQGKSEGKLYVYESIREDAYQLFGFFNKAERMLFIQLVSVSGVGGQTARMILSAFTPAELANIIRTENAGMLKSVKGIGPKAAQRIIVELKDKISLEYEVGTDRSNASAEIGAPREIVEEAVAALTMLGFPPAPTQKTVLHIVKENPSLSVEQIIKAALKML
ncbi:MAG: Holliday junction branch migration protein RuvA [Bacteroidaceae bacterium]|nr:Holliday junction branch migration protein RuvA [Bacteroidaceae bacterium]